LYISYTEKNNGVKNNSIVGEIRAVQTSVDISAYFAHNAVTIRVKSSLCKKRVKIAYLLEQRKIRVT
jgi:hypothetical protein